jgi:hypothetical protein
MAKRKVNKSEEIRAFIKEAPKARVGEIVEGLAGRGVKVSAGLVSKVRGGGVARRKIRKAAFAGDIVMQVRWAKEFVRHVGDVGAAKQALAVYEEITT